MALHPVALALLLAFAAPTLGKDLGPTKTAPLPVLDSKGCIKAKTFNNETNYFSNIFLSQPFANSSSNNTYKFSVRYYRYFKVVRDLWAGTQYVLYMCGGPRPNLGTQVQYFAIPLQTYAVYDDVPANYLQMLGQQSRLGAAPPGSMVDPCMQKLVKPLPAALASAPVFNSFLDPFAYQGYNISFSATYESNPARRAEWIKYLSLFFNREAAANIAYNKIYKSYSCNIDKAKAARGVKPRVGWINYYNGIWTLSTAGYKLKFVNDAGGVNTPATADTYYNMSNPEKVTAFRAMLKTLDVALDESYLPSGPAPYTVAQFRSLAKLSAAQALTIPFLRTKNLWTIYGQYTPDFYFTGWYEGAIAQPQVVLQELVSILQPKAYPQGIKYTFLANVVRKTATAVTAASCTASNVNAAVPPFPAGCTV